MLKKKLKMLKKKIKYNLKFKSFDQKLLAYNLITILFELKKKLNFIKINNISTMPYNTKKFCVIRSPFVDKVSKEHFELRIFKNSIIIEVIDPENPILEKFLEISIVNVLKMQELTINYKKFKIIGF